ncbi:hypothetical protein VHEMI02873 [[Torrubiella] hemipterigena]|nr:hypothetical protein VHEMI02873 [[Torrubiella] hemipterigena]
MFTFTFIPQMTMLFFVNGPLAVVTTSLLVLSESSAIINGIARGWLLQEGILDTFDATLLSRNATAIVREGRVVTSGANSMAKLGKIIKSPFDKFSPKAFVRYLIYLPFNFIPLVGTAIFVYLQGKSRGRLVHERYFQLKKWNSSQKSAWLTRHVGPYTAFGLVATALEMVPVASIFFTYTNTVGAALWAADIEANKSLVERAIELRETTQGGRG